MKVRIAAPAVEQARAIDRWWRANRPAASRLFADELAAAYRALTHTPELGVPYVERQGLIVRRLLLRKTHNHVYYEVDTTTDTVMVLAIWGAPKGEGPKL